LIAALTPSGNISWQAITFAINGTDTTYVSMQRRVAINNLYASGAFYMNVLI